MFNFSKGQKSLLIIFFIIMTLLLVAVGGFYAVKTLYPIKYVDEINAASEEFGVDKYLICAVIDTESGFDAGAVSHVGATGLMQIMPDTGGWIANKLGEEYSDEALNSTATNIRYGTWYLSYLLNKFDGNTQLTAAAYNAGHNNVEGWLDEIYIDGEVLTENIPFEETRNYVKKVDSAYEIYKTLYPNI